MINNPDWRKRRLAFQASPDTHQVTVRFANPGRAGLHPDLGANSDGHSGMLLAHIVMEEANVVRFSVTPPEPPDGVVTLPRGGEIRYPGVELRADERGPFPRQTVTVTLPQGKGLQFVSEGGPSVYQLTVQALRDGHGTVLYTAKSLSPDGQTLAFEGVDLGLSGERSTSRAWVAVKAANDAPLGDTHLSFQVGGQTSNSTLVHVVAPKVV